MLYFLSGTALVITKLIWHSKKLSRSKTSCFITKISAIEEYLMKNDLWKRYVRLNLVLFIGLEQKWKWFNIENLGICECFYARIAYKCNRLCRFNTITIH